MLDRIRNGRTDLVFEWTAAGNSAGADDGRAVPLIRWCAYYGDVSAIRHLLGQGERIETLGDNLDLNGAAFHGHWQLCQFLIEQGADPNRRLAGTGETPLHAALTKACRPAADLVVRLLLAAGGDPNAATFPGAETGSFMRDARTRIETPLHRAAAFGSETSIRMLLDAGAALDARDANGDSPLSWASWHLRPPAILRLLCFDGHSVRADTATLDINLLGNPGGDVG
jgi:ankyrin repeat protein